MVLRQLLEDAGLTRGEIEVYLALLKIGESTTGKIVSDSKVSSSKVYEILNKLISKGLASFTVRGSVKFFSAASPKRILNYLNEKESDLHKKKLELEKELPALLALEQSRKTDYETHLFRGFKGIESAIYDALNELDEKSEVLAMGVRAFHDVKFRLLWKKWHNERMKRKISCRVIFSDKAEYHEVFKTLKLTQGRELGGVTPAAIDIMGDKVLIFTYTDDLSCLLIKNREIAQSFTTFFNNLWNLSKPVQRKP